MLVLVVDVATALYCFCVLRVFMSGIFVCLFKLLLLLGCYNVWQSLGKEEDLWRMLEFNEIAK